MMTTSEKVCLKWNDFQDNISKVFGTLRESYDFADVTLACEDGLQVEAHKVILATSSPFFQELLRKNKHPHPLIYMRGIRSEILVAIIDFLYKGEANIYQEKLDDFLAIAKELRLKGLTVTHDFTDVEKYTTNFNSSTKQDSNVDPSKNNLESSKTIKYKESNCEIRTEFVKIENNFTPEEAVAIPDKIFVEGLRELDEEIKSMMESFGVTSNGQAQYTCKSCGKSGAYRSIKDHIELHHTDGISHPCNFCEKTFR